MDNKDGKKRNQKVNGKDLERKVDLGIGVLLAVTLLVLTIVNYDPNSKKVLEDYLNGKLGNTVGEINSNNERFSESTENVISDKLVEGTAPVIIDEIPFDDESGVSDLNTTDSSSNPTESNSSNSSDKTSAEPSESNKTPDESMPSVEKDPEASAVAVPDIVNINTADLNQLQTLNGIGEVKAQAIIDYREAHGAFRSVDELTNVKGIGDKTLEKNRDRITV